MSHNDFEHHENWCLPQKRSFAQTMNNDIEVEPHLPHSQDKENQVDVLWSELYQKRLIQSSENKISDCRDRYIPTRTKSLLEFGLYARPKPLTPHGAYVMDVLLGGPDKRILSYEKPYAKKKEESEGLMTLSMVERITGQRSDGRVTLELQTQYKFNTYKTLDAVGLYSDFYYHLLSWSKVNRIFIALKNGINQFVIYSCTPESTGTYSVYVSDPMPPGVDACAIKAFGETDIISGWKNGLMMIHTIEEQRVEPKHGFQFPNEPLNCIEVIDKNNLWLGTKKGWMNGYDLRQAGATFRFANYNDTSLSIDGLAGIAFNQEYLVAVGTNNGMVKIWDIRRPGDKPYFSDQVHHQSGIKALAFNPNAPKQLVSGGGSNCRQVILRNILNHDEPQKKHMGCQVTGVSFLEKKNHFVASSGFNGRLGLFKSNHHHLEQLAETNLSKEGVQGRLIYLTTHGNECAVAYDGNETLNYYRIDGIEEEKSRERTHGKGVPGCLKTTGAFSIR